MKTRSLVIAIALMITATASLVAQNPSTSLDIQNQEGSSVYKLVYKAQGPHKANLKIYNSEGLLYSKAVNFTNQFIFPLDFNGMGKGEYTFEVAEGRNSVKKSIEFDTKMPLAFVHVSKHTDDKYLLSIKSQAPTDFTVRIFDRWNREVFLKEESVDNEYALIYNLTNLAGPFNFEVTNATGEVAIVKN